MYYVNGKDIAEAVMLVSQFDDTDIGSVEGNAEGNVIVKTVSARYVVNVKKRTVWRLLDWRLGIWEELTNCKGRN